MVFDGSVQVMDINRPISVALLRSSYSNGMTDFFEKYIQPDTSTITIAQLCESIIEYFWQDEDIAKDDQIPSNYVERSSLFGIACEIMNLLDDESKQYIAKRSCVICIEIKDGVDHASLTSNDIIAITFRDLIQKMINLQSPSGGD